MLEVHFNNPQMEKGNYYNFLGIDSIYRAIFDLIRSYNKSNCYKSIEFF